MKKINKKAPVLHGPNGPIRYEPPYLLPEGSRASCNLCKPVQFFKTIDEAEEHLTRKHRVWKG